MNKQQLDKLDEFKKNMDLPTKVVFYLVQAFVV